MTKHHDGMIVAMIKGEALFAFRVKESGDILETIGCENSNSWIMLKKTATFISALSS